jgi:hypothetical protein
VDRGAGGEEVIDLSDLRRPAEQASWWRRPTRLAHVLALLVPLVFLVEFFLALVGYARDWFMALAIAAFITPITLGLIALVWRPPREPGQDE